MSAEQYHEEEALGKAYDARLMKRLMAYLRPYRWHVVLAVFLLLTSSASSVAIVYVQKWGIDSFIMTGNAAGLNRVAAVFLVVMLVGFGAGYGQSYLTMWLGQHVLYDIRMQIFRHLQRLHPGFFDKNPVGRLVTRVTNDVNTLNEMFSAGVVAIIGDIFMLTLIIGAMLQTNWQLALWTFLVLPLLIVATFYFRIKVRRVYRQVRLKLARINAFLQEHISGIKVVRLFTQEERTAERFDDINRDLRDAHFRSIYYYALFFPTVQIISTLSLAVLCYKGGFEIHAGQLTWGELAAFISLLQMFYRPLQDLSEKYNILQASMASSERIFNLLDTPPAIVETPRVRRHNNFTGRIEFDHVWFAYNDDDWVLRDVTFTVEPGQKVAIVGATGAGKSSLISLLYRFYDYQRGAVRLNGVPITELSISELRSHLGLVLQDVFLFSGTLAGNVRLRDETITDEQVRQALHRVGFDRFLGDDGLRLDTEIKERGATLSTGQKQLLSFARALAFDPDILILDEATSSVDTDTELLIQRGLEELLKDRTAIIIAHRLSTIEKADKILVLHHGELREQGTHEELLRQGGLYYTLYRMQYKKEPRQARAAGAAG